MTTPRIGDWIQVGRSGRQFWPLDPRPEEVFIEDIICSLAKITRFNGHCISPYSVAQHSILVARQVNPEYALEAILHDGAEAFISDIPRPVKRYLVVAPEGIHGEVPFVPIEDVERRIMDCINVRFGVNSTEESRAAIHKADNQLLVTEARDLMQPLHPDWKIDWNLAEPLPERIVPWSWQDAEQRFLDKFHELSDNKFREAANN